MKKLIFVLVGLSFFGALFFSFFSLSKITGQAMEPTLKNGTNVLFRRWGNNLKRGDVVLYRKSYGNGAAVDYVGRIVGLPQESARIENGFLYIGNNKDQYRVEEEYLATNTKTNSYQEGEWFKIGQFEYLVLTDKRDNKISLPTMMVHKSNIKGTLIYKF
jgi:signal peptidase I